MAPQVGVITDEHVSKDLVEQLRLRGFLVVRVVDEPRLGKQALDLAILDFAVEKGYILLTRDGRIQQWMSARIASGKKNPGVVCWLQKYKRMSIGHVIRCLETLRDEKAPFARGLRYIKPSGV